MSLLSALTLEAVCNDLMLQDVLTLASINQVYRARTKALRIRQPVPMFSQIHWLDNAGTHMVLPAKSIYTGFVDALAWTSDGHILAYAIQARIVLYDIQAGQVIKQSHYINGISHLAFSRDNTRLMIIVSTFNVFLWDVQTCCVHPLFDSQIMIARAFWSSDGTRIMVVPTDETVYVYDVAQAQVTHKLIKYSCGILPWENTLTMSSSCLSRSDKTLYILYDTFAIFLFTTALATGPMVVYCIAWSSDGTQLVSGSNDKIVRIWNTKTSEQVAVLEGHPSGVIAVVWSPQGNRIASQSKDGTICVWDTKLLRSIMTIKSPVKANASLAFNQDGSSLACVVMKSTVSIYRIQ